MAKKDKDIIHLFSIVGVVAVVAVIGIITTLAEKSGQYDSAGMVYNIADGICDPLLESPTSGNAKYDPACACKSTEANNGKDPFSAGTTTGIAIQDYGTCSGCSLDPIYKGKLYNNKADTCEVIATRWQTKEYSCDVTGYLRLDIINCEAGCNAARTACNAVSQPVIVDTDADGYAVNGNGRIAGVDCKDNMASVNPGAKEVCKNGIDDNCNGIIDEVATEICGNNIDDNCNGVVDENKRTYYQDADRDLWGNTAVSQTACATPTGYTPKGGDCNDSNSGIRPGLTDTCGDGIDQNCDGSDSACGGSTSPTPYQI